ncbi:MAG: hypothetical protein JWN85_3213, partial [Gammaproteobacteria bacterium]|nr:hypothetical protein [Gammaproteobacteria bacterium]
ELDRTKDHEPADTLQQSPASCRSFVERAYIHALTIASGGEKAQGGAVQTAGRLKLELVTR